ncbi:MAG: serine--tRNA ligase [Bdellovibrionales bacterium]
MHDIRYIRENGEAFDAAMVRRGLEAQSYEVLQMDGARRDVQTQLQDLQAKRNAESKKIGQLKAAGEDASAVMEAVASMKEEMAQLEDKERALASSLNQCLAGLPNIMADDVPDGADESNNIEMHLWGEPRQDDVPEHYEIGEKLGLMDFETAAKMSGSRFVLLSGALARMERALSQFFLDTHTGEHGYTEVSPPLLVRDNALYGTGQLPKFAEDQFSTQETDHFLIPTSEVPLTNIVADSIVNENSLPRRYTAFTPNFRSEAGSAGRDTRGMLRQHQFYKVEQVCITKPEDSDAEQKRILECAENVMQALKLPYRVVTLCSGDTGFGARRTFDIEVWLPGQKEYREIASISNCGDFQARRMNARFKRDGEKQTTFVHTLNGSGVAVGRALIAVIENYYDAADGSIIVPDVLRPYMGGLAKVTNA